jgi:hypothetical protein
MRVGTTREGVAAFNPADDDAGRDHTCQILDNALGEG